MAPELLAYRFLEVESASEADENGPESDGSDASELRYLSAWEPAPLCGNDSAH